MTSDGYLRHRSSSGDAQEGFVGVTGNVLIIEKDGPWRIAGFLKESGKTEEFGSPERTGKLTRSR
jgi:hypothetical protein